MDWLKNVEEKSLRKASPLIDIIRQNKQRVY